MIKYYVFGRDKYGNGPRVGQEVPGSSWSADMESKAESMKEAIVSETEYLALLMERDADVKEIKVTGVDTRNGLIFWEDTKQEERFVTEVDIEIIKETGDSCETCKHDSEPWDSEACDGCTKADNRYEPDLISRDEAVALVNRAIRGISDKDVQEYLFDGLRKQMWALPSASQKVGEWVAVHSGGFTPGGNPVRQCSECGWVFGAHMIYPDYNYCPNCGARMIGE